MDLVKIGSATAKNGFKNEKDIANKFQNYQTDTEAQKWLCIMGYNLKEIEYVKATVLHGYKADINVQVQIKLKKTLDTENIQVKLVSQSKGFNQIDKRWLSHYKNMWNIPEDIFLLLQYYTGEKLPYKIGTKDSRRMFMTEFSLQEQKKIIEWFSNNSTLILSDIIKGRGKFTAEWILVAQILKDEHKSSIKSLCRCSYNKQKRHLVYWKSYNAKKRWGMGAGQLPICYNSKSTLRGCLICDVFIGTFRCSRCFL